MPFGQQDEQAYASGQKRFTMFRVFLIAEAIVLCVAHT